MSEKSPRDPNATEQALRMAMTNDGTPSPSYESNVLPVENVNLNDYLRVLYKRRWTAVTAFLIVLLAFSLHTFTATPIYEARAQILIEKEAANVVSFKGAFEQNQIADDYYQTQYKILQSRVLARRTLDALKLWDHAQFNPASNDSLTARRLVATSVRTVLGWFTGERTNERPLMDETKKQSATIDRFLSDLTVSPIRNSRLVDVAFESPDPVLAANVANVLARSYIDQNLEFKFLSSKEASDWLGERLAEQRKLVEASEQAVQRYREQTDAVSLEEKQNIVVQKLADLNAAVTRAKTERIQKEAAYNQIRSLQIDRSALDTFPAILSNGFIQQQKGELAELQRQQAQLSEKFGPRHPEMVKLGLAVQTAEAKIQGEIAKVMQSMHNDYQQALAQEQSLTNALDEQKRDALSLNRKGIEYGVLARDAASNRQIFESLMQRTKETGIAGELKSSNIRVVDAAEVPRAPTRPRHALDLLMGFLSGAVLGIGLVFLFEHLDHCIKSPDEVRVHLGLPFLGMVPETTSKEGRSVSPLLNNGVPAHFAEAFRAIRTNVLFSAAEEGCRSIVITSTGPNEGKTVVAANLAIALAQADVRVLLIDADLRKPRVHAIFAQNLEPGLSNVIVGNAKASEAVHKTAAHGLWVLPAGHITPNPSELLGSRRFKDFLSTVRDHFDWIVVDTPPVMAVTDACVVSHMVSGVLFVVGADNTSRYAARTALDQLAFARARFVGAILNRVNLQRNGYYYSDYYRREYSQYYEQAGS